MTKPPNPSEASIVVTGASGFVGQALVAHLRKLGISHRALSLRPSGDPATVSGYDKARDWVPFLAGADTVVHLAGRAHVMRETSRHPLEIFRDANLLTTVQLANAAVLAGVKRLVFVSTVKVHGEFTEPGAAFKADDPLEPMGPYAVSKAEAEFALRKIEAQSGLEVVIVRPTLVYGPGAKGNMVRIQRWAELGLPSPFANIGNLRSRVHVTNLCDALLLAAQHADGKGRAFLVSDGIDVSTHAMLEEAFSMRGKKPVCLSLPTRFWSVMNHVPKLKDVYQKLFLNLQVNIEDTRAILGYRPVSTALLPR
ncbi:NAD-dependent epimerase/dehydratase family protein [Allorhizobium sp. NPDC080224]|uniref:NAD-dependent epimerase/dehydratase family protein n=1 Tax=Allorhizobium sp. NPDC080224 TaxID=3390547 RepID=UPI003D06D406